MLGKQSPERTGGATARRQLARSRYRQAGLIRRFSKWIRSTTSLSIICRDGCSRLSGRLSFSPPLPVALKKVAEINHRVAASQSEIVDATDKLKRLYRMVEDGVAELDDILRDRRQLKLDRERAQAALDRIRAQALPATEIPPEMTERFGRVMRENIASGEVPFRKAYLPAAIYGIEVDDHSIRIVGDTATLEQVIAGKSVPAAGIRCFFVRKWRARKDSNL